MRPMARIASRTGAVVVALAAVAAGGCGQQQGTGAYVYVRLGSLQYDELRLGVTRTPTGEVVVDPTTAGPDTGPLHPGDQDAIIYPPDTRASSSVRCDATAPAAGAAVGSGTADMLVARGVM